MFKISYRTHYYMVFINETKKVYLCYIIRIPTKKHLESYELFQL